MSSCIAAIHLSAFRSFNAGFPSSVMRANAIFESSLYLAGNLRSLGEFLLIVGCSTFSSASSYVSASIHKGNRNSLDGSIPDELGRLASLEVFGISENELSGRIPPQLYNLSSIKFLGVGLNRLHGNLPPNLGLTLPNLQKLYAGGNQFTGPIPISLSNASGLVSIILASNSCSGSVPTNFGSLKGLSMLLLWGNKLGTGKSHDLIFLDSLTNCSSLRALQVAINHPSGALPDSMSNISTELTSLALGDNKIFGSIPSGIQNLVDLTELDMGRNFLTVTIPIGIGKLNQARKLWFEANELSGQIPSSLGNISQLLVLSLYENNLSGSIPSTIGNCKNLQAIYLHSNKFSSSLPKQLFIFPSLIELYIGNNSFTGSLPVEVGYLKTLSTLNVSNNKLSGEIPSSLGNCLSLEYLLLDGNFFQESIPPTFKLNLPQCSSQASKKRRKSLASKVKISVVAVVVLCLMLVSCIFATLYWIRKSRRKPDDVPTAEDPFVTMSYAELFKATDGFSSANLVATGSFGAVYKGALDRDGTMVAVKVFNLQQQGALELHG
ncbi:LRR receptor-like serine/threonine-protein kinase EFR [Magnolia sinica]|uniref:LRR receptor-like serine/threonine-protein kinase EFR n=1 Tax=Magnolia sinica TaxID=86752 RepID=UPI002658D41D|nr:LRR receptor-like serine/threonine-protein kinase EFR [Magnolia sinica]